MLRKISMGIATLALAAGLAACSVGQGVAVPDREVPIDIDTALEAQNKAANALMAGEVTWTESEFSSLLTELLKANSGENNPVEAITAWFEPDGLYLQVELVDGVLPPAFGNTLAVDGDVTVQDGVLQLTLDEASAGSYTVGASTLAPIAAQINGILASQMGGVPLSIQMEEGSLTVSMQQ
jgi:hypothetical protein